MKYKQSKQRQRLSETIPYLKQLIFFKNKKKMPILSITNIIIVNIPVL